ncbi:unnamed protein product [Protopolystoma xenopodis]|uniref:GHMP kinase N-terminal domain-containing protein n=1 Tax=Protopolystoma xenopodis TaxID=117903 RepID=A0A448X0D1_9PLAT|nr:unnamed protein product [Protopolystoma xenopodis]
MRSLIFQAWNPPILRVLVTSCGSNPARPNSQLPAGAGLSSSSALVVAAALATMRASGLSIDRVRKTC